MKKILFGMMAAAAVLATSCAKELQYAEGDATVTFAVGTPEIATRAYSDGTTATELQYAVYDADGNPLENLKGTQKINISTTVKLQLTTGNTYSVIFWAAAEGAPYTVDFENKTMKVDYNNAVSNDEARDAFFKCHTFTVTGAQTETIELKRPFAQLNIGTADYAASTKAGYTPVKSAVTVKNIYSTLNLWNGEVTDEIEVKYDYAEIAKNEAFPVAGYQYLAMNYLLVKGDDKELVDIEFGYTETDANAAKTRIVGSVPVQRNYRTNIYGNLLTSDVDINVEINPDYNEPDYEADALFQAAAFGGEVTLTEDVVLKNPLEIQANMVLNLGGNTLTGVVTVANGVQATIENGKVVNTDNTVSGITSNGNLTLNNVEVESARHALRIESGNVVINGGTYKVVPVSNSTLYALNAGDGANSVANVVIKGGTFIGPKGTRADSGGAVTVKTGSTVVIEGGDFLGGKTKTISNSGTMTISGGTFDQQPNAAWLKEGYKATKAVNIYIVTKEEVTVATTAAEVKDVFENGGTILLAEDIEFEKITRITPGAEVYLNLNGKTITVDQNTTSNTLIYVQEGAKLIIDGNGTIDLKGVSTMATFAPYGELVIENGTFIRDKVETVTNKTTGLFMGAKTTASNVTINGGYFDAGYYNTDAADIEEILAGSKTFDETADDIAKRGNSGDANKVRVALKENVSALLNHSGYGSFKIYGGTFVGANPAWGDEGCMLPTTPNYLRPWSYYQGALLDGQEFNENGIVLPEGYTITKGETEGIPTYTVTYNK